MKKIYALAGAIAMTSAAFAQGGLAPMKSQKSVVNAGEKHAYAIKDVRHPAPSNLNRGAVYYTEDFENGLTGNNTGTQTASGSWTTAIAAGANTAVGWELTTVGHANDAGSTYTIPPLMSTTGDGVGQWMLLDSDSDGTSGSNEEATLTSPTIDMTTVTNNALALEWQQFFAEWQNDSLWVEVSTDGGTTWNGQRFSDGVGRDNRPNPEVMRMDLTSYALAGQATVQIRFRWVGNWDYGWQVDDIMIVDLPDHNLKLNSALATHYRVHPLATAAGFSDRISYTKVPIGQIAPVAFSGNISNLGALQQDNIYLTAAVTGQGYTGNSVMTGLSLTPNTDSTVTATTYFTPGATAAAYEATFGVMYDNIGMEDNPNGLLDTVDWEVTDFEYSRDHNNYTGPGLWNGETGGSANPFFMGHVWQIETNQTMEGIGIVLTGSSDPGAIVYGQVYEIDTVTGDYVLVATSNDVDVYSYHIPAQTGFDPVKLWVPLQYALEADKQYIIGIGAYGGTEAVVLGNSTEANVSAYTTFLLDGTDQTWYYLTSTPMIRLHFNTPAWTGVEENSENVSLLQNMPNPANNETVIAYEIAESADISFEIMDASGKVVYTVDQGQQTAGTYRVNVNTENFAAGIYHYSLMVNGIRTTKRMVIAK